jgi:hypothetical protein
LEIDIAASGSTRDPSRNEGHCCSHFASADVAGDADSCSSEFSSRARNSGIFAAAARLDAGAMRQNVALRTSSSRLSWVGLTAIIWSCRQPPAPAESVVAAPAGGAAGRSGEVIGQGNTAASSPDTALSASETARLDSVMTPESVFPSEAQRSVYRAYPPEVKDGKRSYTFELLEQPGMVAGQHFHSLTFAFAPAGTFLRAPGTEPEIMSAGGPQGSFVRASSRSADGAYDVSVMERMLLPSTLPRPAIRADTALVAVLERLARASTP